MIHESSPRAPAFMLLFFLSLFMAMQGSSMQTPPSSPGRTSPAEFPVIQRVSVSSYGAQANNSSNGGSISSDGRYVAFHSWATNLVPGDTNGFRDVFVHDRVTGQTDRVSVASNGTQGDGTSFGQAISHDGRYIAFYGEATNLVRQDTDNYWDVFVHDRSTGQTIRVSVASDGTQASGGHRGLLLGSFESSISSDGRYVAFVSEADNLVAGDTNFADDVFVHDQITGETARVSVASDGTQANGDSGNASISGDGRYVAFFSNASNLVSGDSNGHTDVFVHDRVTGDTNRVSIASNGQEANGGSDAPSISWHGRYVAFRSFASNLVPADTNGFPDVFVHDRATGLTTRVSIASSGVQGNEYSQFPGISADGRYVAFHSFASNLVVGDTNSSPDVFVHDRATGETIRVSVSSDGAQANGESKFAGISSTGISANGRYVAFYSNAANLVPDDTNGSWDIFVRDISTLLPPTQTATPAPLPTLTTAPTTTSTPARTPTPTSTPMLPDRWYSYMSFLVNNRVGALPP